MAMHTAYILTSLPVHSKMTYNLRHYLRTSILNIIKIKHKYRIFILNSRKNAEKTEDKLSQNKWYFLSSFLYINEYKLNLLLF